MRLSLKILKQILPGAKLFGLSGNEDIDIFNIAHLKEFESLPKKGNTLYFVVYEDHPEVAGWYNKPFDRSLKIENFLSTNEKIVYLVDSRVKSGMPQGTRYIRVEDIYKAIDEIRHYIVSRINPKVIGVTGSVGKTTGVSLIECVLRKKFGCGRIYSKRLTPLTLSSWLVNFLEPSHEILALEYSMYRKEHVDKLTDLLKPQIGVFLNIKNMHLGVRGVETLFDIQEGKAALLKKSDINLLNADDKLAEAFKRKGDLRFSLVDPKADAFVKNEGDNMVLILNYTGQVIRFVPYIKTNLFYHQVAAAGLLGGLFGISSELVGVAIEEFRPAEHRIQWINILGEQVLLDGDVTMSGRMVALTEHQYSNSILFIHSFDFGEENVEIQVEDFSLIFSKFNEVRVLDKEENKAIVSQYSFKNLSLVQKKMFFNGLSDFDFKIFHFGTYFRKHKDLSHLMTFINS